MGIRTGAMWCWTNARWVSFFYSASGDSDSVRRFLGENLQRTVQCDGTSVMTFLERAGGKRPGCWGHARRRFVEPARSGDTIALEACARSVRSLRSSMPPSWQGTPRRSDVPVAWNTVDRFWTTSALLSTSSEP